MKKLLKFFTNRILITVFFFLLQVAVLSVTLFVLSAWSVWIQLLFSLLSIVVCLFILGKDQNPGYKLAWVIPILLFPLLGGALFVMMGRPPKLRRKYKKQMDRVTSYTQELFREANRITADNETRIPPSARRLYRFVNNGTDYPLYGDTETTYYDGGEAYFDAVLDELRKAQKFIYIEFFIIAAGKLWDRILDVLREKVAEGVEVRVIYDDVGCLFTLPAGYYKKLRAMGIRAHVFNKIRPVFDIRMNNRTHRKIIVIDNKVAFTGGLNIADEYVNRLDRHGYWKDTGMKFEGAAAASFSIMFLRFWLLLESEDADYARYLPRQAEEPSEHGWVQPLSAGPGNNLQIIENAFMELIGGARESLYITTPYLILDNEFVTALVLAAKSGIDVRIALPHVPDKKLVFMMSRSFYSILLKAGVKIYEYLPGFLHAKSVVCDDGLAYIGTCNLDYRSFYLHYECGALLYETPTVAEMKQDFLRLLPKCKEITYEEASNVTVFTKAARAVLRLFAPLM